ncbi:MAG: phytanoyl-CoA dioxygenase family protein [Chitinophagaceae bacterium]
MIDCPFLPVFYEYHQCIKAGRPVPDYDDFVTIENIWLGVYGLGKFETYQFLYDQCSSLTHLQQWIIALKGKEHVETSVTAFDEWIKQKTITQVHSTAPKNTILNNAQWQHWRQQGYVIISNLVAPDLCDAVCRLICMQLGASLQAPETWYNDHPQWHGLMLQLYQHPDINAIRTLPVIQQLFVELYGTTDIIANTEKVSFNPPETDTWKFRHHQLHWDIDFTRADRYYIQGLVYLDDVPEDRGPLTVVPGFHHQFEDWIKTYPDPHEAQQAMQHTFTGTPVPGKKGDLILWLQTLPHAASANHSNLPRFVQYVSFSKL